MVRYLSIGIIIVFNFCSILSQDTISTKNLFSPLNIPITFSGNFGEIRSVQFHTGVDIRTNMQEGFPVFAVADGYVSRLKVEMTGYGKAVYIDHPDGTTTVYGHLRCFNDTLDNYVKTNQYDKNSFAVDLYPAPGQFPIRKGEIIGLSGNMGISTGPHLHFESRITKNQELENPLIKKLYIKDTLKPVINSVYVYSFDNRNKLTERKTKYNVKSYQSGKYILKESDTINICGTVGLGLDYFDLIFDSVRKFQLYSTKLIVDSTCIFESVFDGFSFEESTNINSYIDYKQKLQENNNIQLQFVLPNQNLSIYKNVVNRGLISFNDNFAHKIEYIIEDASKNISELVFYMQKSPSCLISKTYQEIKCDKYLRWNKKNSFERDGIKVTFPENCLFDDLCFTYKSSKASYGYLSKIHELSNIYTPLKKPATLSIKPDKFDVVLKEKLLIANVNGKECLSSQGGIFKNGYVTTNISTLGSYAVVVDTTPPEIIPVQFPESYDFSCIDTMYIKITDDLSGIANFNGCIDGHWVLFEYKYFNQGIFFVFDNKSLTYGTIHNLELFVTDKKDNTSVFRMTFYK